MELTRRSACPVCEAIADDPFYERSYADEPLSTYLDAFYGGALDPASLGGHPFALCRCRSCGLVFQQWVPTDAGLAELYGSLALADPATVAAGRGLSVRLNYLHDIERVIRHVGRPPSEVQVLDFGSGTGLWLQAAAALGCPTSAAELDASVVARLEAAGHHAYGLDDLPPDHFDFVNTEQVFEHLVAPREVVGRLAAALVPGGLLRISVPNGSDIAARLEVDDWSAPKGSSTSLNAVAPLEHLNCFDHGSIVALGREGGLRPFTFSLTTEVHQLARLRYAAAAVAHKVRPAKGTLVYLQRPL